MKPRFRRRHSALQVRTPLQQQIALPLPRVPSESPLRAAFRRAELARLGLDFRDVLGHPRGASLLREMTGAYERGNDLAAQAYRRQLSSMRRSFL